MGGGGGRGGERSRETGRVVLIFYGWGGGGGGHSYVHMGVIIPRVYIDLSVPEHTPTCTSEEGP